MNKEFYICPECKHKTEMKHFKGFCPVCGHEETKAPIAVRLKAAKSEKDAAKADLDNAYNVKQNAYYDIKITSYLSMIAKEYVEHFM